MSGTSLDGVDAVLADFAPPSGAPFSMLGAAQVDFPTALRSDLIALQFSGADEIARAARAANALADLYAEAIAQAIWNAGVRGDEVVAAGVHGQTVRHRPGEGWTVQINNPARVAERTGLTIVADFRSRDVAAGGQGAPLVPAFHRALFGDPRVHRVVVNIGGIANLTDLPPGGSVRGFDTGPGNVLLDLWHARHRGGRCDLDGAWAGSGAVDERLLESLAAEPFFAAPPPKSTGRDLFGAAWLDARLIGIVVPPADVQATLVELTVRTIQGAIARHMHGAAEVLVCGGGAHNSVLMARLAAELAPRRVAPTSECGVAVEHVEALAFAWLARAAIERRTGNLPAVTGARGERVLGAIYPA